jgi:hypothetical protein
MDPTCRQIEDITGFDLMVSKDFGDGAVNHALLVFLGGYLLFEACIEVGAWLSLDDVPHLGFTHLTMLSHSHLVIRMHLDAEVALCINELDEQRQFALVFLVNGFAKDIFWMLVDNGDQIAAFITAIAYYAGAGWHSTNLPTLTNRFISWFQAFIWSKFISAPDY